MSLVEVAVKVKLAWVNCDATSRDTMKCRG
jgi:hypothetical protein